MIRSKHWSLGISLMLSAIGGVALLWTPLWTGFPATMPDTWGYLNVAADVKVLPVRPGWYGFFLMPFIKSNWWGAVVVQVLVVALTACRAAASLSDDEAQGMAAGGLSLVVVAVLTGVSLNVTRLVPDFLAPALFFATLLLLFGKNLFDRLLGMAVTFAAVLSHSSHLATAFLLLLVVAAAKCLRRLPNVRVGPFVGTVLAALLLVPAANWLRYDAFRFSFGSGAFLTNRLRDMGVLQRYLDESCPKSDHPLCSRRTDLGGDLGYLWKGNESRSVVEEVGGWTGNGYLESVASQAVARFPLEVAYDTLINSVRQLISYDANWRPSQEGLALRASRTMAPSVRERIERATDRRKIWPTLASWSNRIQNWAVISALALSVWLCFFSSEKRRGRARLALGLTAVYLLLNAAVCGGLSGVFDRYQSRVVWLLPFMALVLLARPKSDGLRPSHR